MTTATEERKESVGWLELFFDLVVVAAVAVLTEGLQEDLRWPTVALTALLYSTIWVSWSLTVMYANVAAEQTRLRTVTITMFLIAMMTAAAPVHDADRANVFAIGFLVVRVVVARGSLRTGRILGSWPLLQFGGMSLPWLVSLWVDDPVKYWLWAAGLALDLVLVALRGDEDGDLAMERMRVQRAREVERHPGSKRQVPELVAVDVDRSHLDERLGLFVIIVLGEAVIQLVHAAATHPWDRPFEATSVAAFFLLTGLWRASFAHGFTGAPHTRLAELPPRVGLPLHLAATLGLVLVAAGLGELVAEPAAEVEPAAGWLLAGGLAAYFAVGLVGGILGGAPRRWLLLFSGASTAYAVALGLVGPHVHVVAFAWLAAVPAVWQAFSGRPDRGSDDGAA